MKLPGWTIWITLFFVLVSVECFKNYREQHARAERLTVDLKAEQQGSIYFKTRAGEQAVKIQALEMTVREIKSIYPSVIKAADNLKIPPGRIENFTQANSVMKKEIITVVKDSIVHDTIKVLKLNYEDQYYSVKGEIQKDTARLAISSRDTITIVDYKGPRPHPWLWILGGKRQKWTTITNTNPSNSISIIKKIQVVR